MILPWCHPIFSSLGLLPNEVQMFHSWNLPSFFPCYIFMGIMPTVVLVVWVFLLSFNEKSGVQSPLGYICRVSNRQKIIRLVSSGDRSSTAAQQTLQNKHGWEEIEVFLKYSSREHSSMRVGNVALSDDFPGISKVSQLLNFANYGSP